MFSAALASGQLGPLMSQFGLPAEAVDAANKGGMYQCCGERDEVVGFGSFLCVCVFCVVFLHCTYIALDCRRSAHDSEQLSEADSYTAGFKIKGQVWLRCCAAATVLMSGLGVENSGLCRGRC